MKNLLVACFISLPFISSAQKADYKIGVIQVDGQDLAKMSIEKKNFGLTKNFEVFSMAGKKLIISIPASGFETNKDDHLTMYYRLLFLISNQAGTYSLQPRAGKIFLKLIGTSGIIQGDSTDDTKVKELIAMKSARSTVVVDYKPVYRNHIWPVRLQMEEKNFEQDGKLLEAISLRVL